MSDGPPKGDNFIGPLHGQPACDYCGGSLQPYPWHVQVLERKPQAMCNYCVVQYFVWANKHGHATSVCDDVRVRSIRILKRDPREWAEHYLNQLDTSERFEFLEQMLKRALGRP